MNSQEIDLLVARVRQGDRDAFGELVFAVEDELRAFLGARADSLQVVDEVVQSTLITAYENLGKYELRGTFLSWIKGIGRNLLMREIQARVRNPLAGEDAIDRFAAASALEAARAEADSEDRLARLDECLQKLPADARDLLRRRYRDRASVKDLARELNRTETAVSVALFRIREQIRQYLAEGGSP